MLYLDFERKETPSNPTIKRSSRLVQLEIDSEWFIAHTCFSRLDKYPGVPTVVLECSITPIIILIPKLCHMVVNRAYERGIYAIIEAIEDLIIKEDIGSWWDGRVDGIYEKGDSRFRYHGTRSRWGARDLFYSLSAEDVCSIEAIFESVKWPQYHCFSLA